MICVVAGRVVDIVDREFTSKKDDKKVEYSLVNIIDEDAFLDSDRIFSLRVSQDKAKNIQAGNSYQFKGTLSTDKGLLKFRVNEVLPVK